MHWRSFDGTPAVSAFATACSYVVVAVFLLLSGGMLEVRRWTATIPAWADLIAKPPAALPECSVTAVSNVWLHVRLCAGPISGCSLTTEGAASSNSTFSPLLSRMTSHGYANKSLCRYFCLQFGSCAIASNANLQ